MHKSIEKEVTKNPVKNENALEIITGNRFLRRIYLSLTNPFRYIFLGKIRY